MESKLERLGGRRQSYKIKLVFKKSEISIEFLEDALSQFRLWFNLNGAFSQVRLSQHCSLILIEAIHRQGI